MSPYYFTPAEVALASTPPDKDKPPPAWSFDEGRRSGLRDAAWAVNRATWRDRIHAALLIASGAAVGVFASALWMGGV